ncbi:hypothetical protein Angca_008212, partial [Angiostrongylus cantonensis]
MKLVTLLAVLWATTSECFDIDNGVIEGPKVHCGVDKIAVDITTEKPYKGRLYVQGESYNERCFQEAQDPYSEHAHFELPIGACNMRRQRTMQPRGVSFSFTLVVSFHPFFVVGIDRAFHIQCFFLESVKSLNAGFDVGRLRTELVERELKLPECLYQLRDGVNGPSVQYAEVGQRVTHRWICEDGSNYIYGMLIHSCLVDDGQGNQFELVDDRGCSKDSYLLPQIEYDPHSLSAFTDAPVFKYADKVQIYFTCTVQLCYRHDGGCDGVTPPACDNDLKHFPDKDTSFRHSIKPQQEIEALHESSLLPREFHDFEIPDISQNAAPFVGPLREAKEFFGPIDIIDEMRRHPYKDSPLNETDADDVALLRWNTTAGASVNESMTEISKRKGIGNQKKTKKRRDLNMETDLSVDVIVLPVEKKDLGQQRSLYICVSRTASLLILLAALITI